MLSKAWVPAFYLEYLLIDPRPQPPQEGIRAKPTAGVSQVTCQLVLNPQVTSHQPRMGSCPTGTSVPSPTTRKLENPAPSSREPAVTLPGVNHLDIGGLCGDWLPLQPVVTRCVSSPWGDSVEEAGGAALKRGPAL